MADNKPQAQPAQQPKGPETEIYRVVGPGSVLHKGEAYAAGDPIELTKEDADSLGELVESADSPQFVPIGKRGDGLYQVVGPGSVLSGGKAYGPRATLRLSAEEANSIKVPLKLVKAA